MAEGNKTFMGLAVPLNGECEITQITAATDILTLTGNGSMSGDFIVGQTSAGTEKFVVDANGKITAAGGVAISSGKFLNLPVATTAITTGLVAGDMYLLKVSTAVQLGICISAAGNTCYYITASTTDAAQ
jgi:hypothetical protein